MRRTLGELFLAMLLYCSSVLIYMQVTGNNPMELVVSLAWSVPEAFMTFFQAVGYVGLGLLVAGLFLPRPVQARVRNRIGPACLTLVAATLLFVSFAMMKEILPQELGFRADDLFAELDNALHFGVDPWRLTHAVFGGLPMDLIGGLYFDIWVLPAMYLPVFIVLFETDPDRHVGFQRLWIMVWVLLGTALSAAALTAGPVYHDQLPGVAARFSELGERLAAADAVRLHAFQQNLWQLYVAKDHLAGSGISAFPSVHVGMATVVALYLSEVLPSRRILGCRPDRVVPIAIVGFYQIASVHLGWHYAVDGYASILLVGAAAWLLGRGPWAQPAATAQASDTA